MDDSARRWKDALAQIWTLNSVQQALSFSFWWKHRQ